MVSDLKKKEGGECNSQVAERIARRIGGYSAEGVSRKSAEEHQPFMRWLEKEGGHPRLEKENGRIYFAEQYRKEETVEDTARRARLIVGTLDRDTLDELDKCLPTLEAGLKGYDNVRGLFGDDFEHLVHRLGNNYALYPRVCEAIVATAPLIDDMPVMSAYNPEALAYKNVVMFEYMRLMPESQWKALKPEFEKLADVLKRNEAHAIALDERRDGTRHTVAVFLGRILMRGTYVIPHEIPAFLHAIRENAGVLGQLSPVERADAFNTLLESANDIEGCVKNFEAHLRAQSMRKHGPNTAEKRTKIAGTIADHVSGHRLVREGLQPMFAGLDVSTLEKLEPEIQRLMNVSKSYDYNLNGMVDYCIKKFMPWMVLRFGNDMKEWRAASEACIANTKMLGLLNPGAVEDAFCLLVGTGRKRFEAHVRNEFVEAAKAGTLRTRTIYRDPDE